MLHEKKTNILPTNDHVLHIFAVMRIEREAFQKYFFDNDIQTIIPYSVQSHKHKVYSEWIIDNCLVSELTHEHIFADPKYGNDK